MYQHSSPTFLLSALQDWWETHSAETLSVRGLLQFSAPPVAYLEQQEHPNALAISHRPQSYTLAARDWDAGRQLLRGLLEKDEPFFSAAALAEPMVSLVEEVIAPQWNVPCHQMLLPDSISSETLDLLCEASTEEGELVELTLEDVSLVLEHWPYGDPDNDNDREFVTRCLQHGPSSAWKQDGRLCSWMLSHLDGSLGFLHTLSETRQQGLATKVVADLARKTRRQRNWTPFLYVVDGNSLPRSVFARVGFEIQPIRKIWIGGPKRQS